MAIRGYEFEDNQQRYDASCIKQGELHHATPEFLQRVLQVRERIMRESKGILFEDSAQLIRQQREERTQHLMELFTGDTTNSQTINSKEAQSWP